MFQELLALFLGLGIPTRIGNSDSNLLRHNPRLPFHFDLAKAEARYF